MENFDQLDRILAENETLVKHVIVFVVSAVLFFVLCALIYALVARETAARTREGEIALGRRIGLLEESVIANNERELRAAMERREALVALRAGDRR